MWSFLSNLRDRLTGRRKPLTLPPDLFLPPTEGPDDDEPYWEARWREDIARVDPAKYNTDIRPGASFHEVESIRKLRARAAKKVLFVGNGIAQTPKAFAFAGFEAVALDFSRVATDFARDYALPDRELRLFFQRSLDGERTGGDFSAEYAEPDGSVRFVVGDLFDPNAEPGPFDHIIADRSLQGSRFKRIDEVVDALDARLAPGGVLRISIANSVYVFGKYEEAFTSRGYAREWEETGKKLLRGGVSTG